MIRGIENELQDYRHLVWTHRRNSSGTAGTFLKSEEVTGGRKVYYKLSDYDYEKGIVGHECVYELLTDRLLSILGVEHLSYRLIHALVVIDDREYETYLCASDDYKRPGESKIALDDFCAMTKEEGERDIDFCIRMGWEDYLYTMRAVDFLIINRDRHGANIEVLKSDGKLRLSPLFDHGLSFLFSARTEKEIAGFDPMSDVKVQSFMGSQSLFENLHAIPRDKKPRLRRLMEEDRRDLFENIEDVISEAHQDKLWEILWNRWNYYENL